MSKVTLKNSAEKPSFAFGTVWKPKRDEDLYVVSFALENGKNQKILVNINNDFQSFWDTPDGCLRDYEHDNLIYIGKISEVVVEKP